MNKLILLTSVAILSFGAISESRAECVNNQTCGDDCCWSIDNGTLNITGSGKMDGYAVSTDQPWNSQKDSITAINVSGVDNIGYRAFQFLDKVNNVILSDSVKEVEHRAFWGNTSLTSISMPNVTSIGNNAFTSTRSLTSVNFGENSQLTSIGDHAFEGASGLTSITIPDSVTSIGGGAFMGASSLESITLPKGLTSIGAAAFTYARSLTSITIPEGVTSIGNSVFNQCSNLTSITIPDTVTSIGALAFQGTNITSITIPEGVTSIGNHAFNVTRSLTSITLPGSLTEVGANLFNASGLKNINCAGTESECAALESLLDEKGYLNGRNFNRVEPVTKCSSYTSSGCNACYAGYAFGNSSCHACGTGKNCHWDETGEKVVFDGCKDKYLRKENECVASSQGCGANFRLNDGECDRLRYTPADAAKVLTDDNNNSVTITFKM